MQLRHTFHQMPVLVLHTTIAFFHFSISALEWKKRKATALALCSPIAQASGLGAQHLANTTDLVHSMSVPASPGAALAASAADVVAWLRKKFAGNAPFMEHMSVYEAAFMDNDVDGATMSGLDKDALEDAGVKRPLHGMRRSQPTASPSHMRRWNCGLCLQSGPQGTCVHRRQGATVQQCKSGNVQCAM